MADFFIISQPTSVWEAQNPTLEANCLGVCSDLRNNVETDSLLSKLGNGVDNWNTLPAYNPGGYKVYQAYISQSGTSNPSTTEFVNTIGTITWMRDDTGTYLITSSALFTSGKTLIFGSGSVSGWSILMTSASELDWIQSSDDWNGSIEIRVYP